MPMTFASTRCYPLETIGHWIGGRLLDASPAARTQLIYNPATGAITRQVAMATTDELNLAVQTAQAAHEGWTDTPPVRRARILSDFVRLLAKHSDRLAATITNEHGKVFSHAKDEVLRSIEAVELACSIPKLLKGEFTPHIAPGLDNWTSRRSLGVVVGITPSDAPCMAPCWMFPLALATGNTFVLKPSACDPSASLLIAEFLKQAGLPGGVFNVVQGDKHAVDHLFEHADVKAVRFLGSPRLALRAYQLGAQLGKRVQAHSPGQSHFVVLPDADIAQAVDGLIGSAFGSAGEGISVAVLVGDIADKVVENLATCIRALRVKGGMAPDAEMGPRITGEALHEITRYIEEGVQQGAELVVDGRASDASSWGRGFFIGGTLFDKVTPAMRIYGGEIVGPVVICVRVKEFAEAVKLVNAHQSRNSVVCYTRTGSLAREFARQIQIGMVGINIPIPEPMAWHGSDGWKSSFPGDPLGDSEEGVRFYTHPVSIMQRHSTNYMNDTKFSV
jgi:malonate-semialdehyde dehydrogenase (acetylating) / methylmalonate-semialdehyde dehydrogenase